MHRGYLPGPPGVCYTLAAVASLSHSGVLEKKKKPQLPFFKCSLSAKPWVMLYLMHPMPALLHNVYFMDEKAEAQRLTPHPTHLMPHCLLTVSASYPHGLPSNISPQVHPSAFSSLQMPLAPAPHLSPGRFQNSLHSKWVSASWIQALSVHIIHPSGTLAI